MSTPTKSKWTSRIVRRASTLIAPVRPATPDKDRERRSTSSDREDDTSSLKKFGRSRSNTSLSALINPSAPNSPPPTQPAHQNNQPSPIAESPARELAASQDDATAAPAAAAAAAAKSPLSQEVMMSGDPQTAGAVSPAEYVPPPIVDNTGAGPGAFTDDLDELPQPSDPISDPYAQAANPTQQENQPAASPVAGTENLPPMSVSPEPIVPSASPQPTPPPFGQLPVTPPPIMHTPSNATTEPLEQPVIPSIQSSSDNLATQPTAIPEDQLARSAPFSDQMRASPESVEEAPTAAPIYMPIPIPAQVPTIPATPPSQTYHDIIADQNTAWAQEGPGQQPMSMPTHNAPPSIHSEDSSVNVLANRSLENPFDDSKAVPQHGNGYLQPSTGQAVAVAAAAAALSMPAAVIASNSRSLTGNLDQYPSYQQGYRDDSDTDESQPLLRNKGRKATAASYTFNPSASVPGRNAPDQHSASTPPRLRDRGWVEIHLPDSSVYYVNQIERVVTDVELRNDRLLDAVTTHLNLEQHKDSLDNAPDGAELWLRDAGNAKRGFVPVRWWVNHYERSVTFDKAFDMAVKRKLRKKKDDDEQLDLEYRYWAFVEAHPTHVLLQPKAKQEAYEAINWAMTDRLLPTQSPVPAPFTQEECATLLDLLNRFDNDQNRSNMQIDTAIQTRTVARILIRVVQWRQEHFRPHKPLPRDVTAKTPKPSYRRPFPRVLLDFAISCLCLGIPYFFIDRSRERRVDEEGGLRTAAPMFVIGACTCIMASIVLSASVTFLSLSGLDSIARIAGFVAIISAICSMASTLFAIFTIKTDLERPPQVIGGEGLLMLSKRSVIMSLPVVFLSYSIIAFVTGVILFSLRGSFFTDVSLVRRPFSEYTRWTAAGALGAFAGMVTITVLLFKS